MKCDLCGKAISTKVRHYCEAGVHDSHCCKKHGCKYGDDDCPVQFGNLPGVHCEDCDNPTTYEVEEELHRILDTDLKVPRFDREFPIAMRVHGLVDHFNGLCDLIERQTKEIEELKNALSNR